MFGRKPRLPVGIILGIPHVGTTVKPKNSLKQQRQIYSLLLNYLHSFSFFYSAHRVGFVLLVQGWADTSYQSASARVGEARHSGQRRVPRLLQDRDELRFFRHSAGDACLPYLRPSRRSRSRLAVLFDCTRLIALWLCFVPRFHLLSPSPTYVELLDFHLRLFQSCLVPSLPPLHLPPPVPS